MKKLSLLLVTGLLFSVKLGAQINWQDSSAQAITYWELNDSVAYDIQLENTLYIETVLHDSGWVLNSTQIKNISIAGQQEIETRYIKMK